VTKHAITEGIITRLVEELNPRDENMVKALDTNEYYCKDEWFLSLPEAQADAVKRRIKKCDSLERQIVKLANLDYSKPTNLVGNIKAQDRPTLTVSKPRTAVYDVNPRCQHLP